MPNYDMPIPLDPNTMQPIQVGMLNQQMQRPYGQRFATAGKQFLSNQDLAMALLANSGYSPQKRTFGEILGTSYMQSNQMKSQREDDAFKRQYMQAQMQAMGQKQQGPSSVQEYEYARKNGYTGSYEDWTRFSGQSSRPSSVVEWEHYNGLLEGDKKNGTQNARLYLEMKRNPNWKISDILGAPNVISGTPGGGVQTTPLSTPQAEIDTSAARKLAESEATATGTEVGRTTATAKFDLPRIEDNAKQTLALLDRLERHPGRKQATGASSAVPVEKLPGTEARNFVTLLGQLQGKQFLEAYNMLKGGGQITEVEGKKAESAIATIQDRGQSEEAYLQAIQDLREVINAGVYRARHKAGGSSPKPSGETAAERARRLGL